MILQDYVKVERYSTTTASASGAPMQQLYTVIAKLKCDIQSKEGSVIYPEHGQTTRAYKLMFCYPADIKPNDIITDLSSNERLKVLNVNNYKLLKHMEVSLESGVS